jgi:SM-20-related protein
MEDSTEGTVQFAINPRLDSAQLHEEFRKGNRLCIENFLQPATAEALYKNLMHEVSWRTLVVCNERLLGTPPGEPVTPGNGREILEYALDGARTGFASVYDADHAFPEDQLEGTGIAATPAPSTLADFRHFLSSSTFVDFVGRVTGLTTIDRVSSQATRFRPGHFVMFHSATWSADSSRKRRADFCMDLTPTWKPEWGGLVEFRNARGNTIEGFVPSFNTLDLFLFPQGHWVSAVAPFADGPRLAVLGRLYVK